MALSMVAMACSEDETISDSSAPAASSATSAVTPTTAESATAESTATTEATDETEASAAATEVTEETDASTATTEAEASDLDAAIAYAQEYVGGTPGAAEGDPIVIGYVNEEGGTPAFPEATIGIEAAVKYVNENLGGADGHPIELKKCITNSSEDSTKCSQEMLADDSVSVVVTGLVAQDALAQPLLDGLKGVKPVIIGNPVTTPDFLASDAFAYTPGSPGVIQGLAIMAARYLPKGPAKKVAVVYGDNSGGTVAFTALTKPVLEMLGVTSVVGVPIPDTAGPQDFAPAIQAAGAADADAFLPLVTVQGCIGTAQALKDLAIDTPVVTTGLCFGTPMTEYLAQQGEKGIVPDNWYFGGYGYSYFIRGEPANDSYITMILKYAEDEGLDNVEYTGFAGPMFGNLLTLTKFINEIGADNVSPDTIRSTAKAFTGPMWGVVGPMACGSNPIFPSVCGIQVGVQQYIDGDWVSIKDGYNGEPIDPSVELAG